MLAATYPVQVLLLTFSGIVNRDPEVPAPNQSARSVTTPCAGAAWPPIVFLDSTAVP